MAMREQFEVVLSLGYDDAAAEAVMEHNDLADMGLDVVQFPGDHQYFLVERSENGGGAGGDDDG